MAAWPQTVVLRENPPCTWCCTYKETSSTLPCVSSPKSTTTGKYSAANAKFTCTLLPTGVTGVAVGTAPHKSKTNSSVVSHLPRVASCPFAPSLRPQSLHFIDWSSNRKRKGQAWCLKPTISVIPQPDVGRLQVQDLLELEERVQSQPGKFSETQSQNKKYRKA